MQKNQIRTVLVIIILLLVGLITAILIKRGTSNTALVRNPTPSPSPTTEPRNADNAIARVQRAGAVTAIERGDYRGAIEALSAIVRAGNGVGDEVELLRMAKDLEEKYRKPATGGGGGELAVVSPTVEEPPVVRPTAPTARPVAPVAPKKFVPPPAPRPVVARVTPPEPTTGLLLVTSVPTGLQVEIDGKRSDFTPLRKVVDVGSHIVVIFRRDEPVFRKVVNVPRDGVATVDADLTPPDPKPDPVEPKVIVPPEPKTVVVVTPAEPKPVVVSKPPEPTGGGDTTKPPAAVSSGETGEVLVLQAGLVGDVFIEGVGYGPPPVLAKTVRVGEVTVELRADGSVKRKKTVVVEKGRRTNVQFR